MKTKGNLQQTILMFLFVLMLSSLALYAQRAQRPPAAKQPDYFQWLTSRQDLQDLTRLTLKNGIKILVAESHESNLAALGIHIEKGRGMPADSSYWAAPAALRYLFAGTQKRTAKQIADQLWSLGIQLKLEAQAESVSLWATFPPERTSRVIELFADLLIGSVFPESALADVQKGILLEEAELWTAMTRGLDYRSAWIGNFTSTREWAQIATAIQEVKRSQVLDYWGQALVPGNLCVVLYGDFLPESFVDLAVRRFKDVPLPKPVDGGAEKSKPGVSSVPTPPRFRTVSSSISRCVVRVVYSLPPRTHPDFPALLLASYMLLEGNQSYLNRRLVENKKVALALQHFIHASRKEDGELCIQIEGEPEKIDAMEIELFTALNQWNKMIPTAAELARAQALAASAFFARQETLLGRAANMLQNELAGGYKSWAQQLDALKKIGPEDVTKAAAKYFGFGQVAITELWPISAEPRHYTMESFRRTMQQILDAGSSENPSPESGLALKFDLVDIPALIKKYAPTEIPTAPYRTSILRGPELQIWEIHTLPIVHLGIFYPGSLHKEGADKSGMTYLMLSSILRSSAKRTFDERSLTLESWGGKIEPYVGKDFFGYRMQVLAPFAEKAMDLLLDVIRNRDFVDQDVAQVLALLKGSRMRLIDNPQQQLRRQIERELYGNHMYGGDPLLLSPVLADVKAAQVLEWYGQFMEDVLPMVVVIGDTPGTSLATYFAKHFSGSKYKTVKLDIPPTTPPKEAKSFELPATIPGHREAAIAVLGPEGENEETIMVQLALAVANRQLDANSLPPVSRLEGQSLAELSLARKGGCLLFHVTRASQDAQDPAQVIIEAMSSVPPAQGGREVLEGARTAYLRRLQDENQCRWALLLRYAQGHFSQNQYYSAASISERAEAITMDEFIEVAKRYLSQDKRIQVIGK